MTLLVTQTDLDVNLYLYVINILFCFFPTAVIKMEGGTALDLKALDQTFMSPQRRLTSETRSQSPRGKAEAKREEYVEPSSVFSQFNYSNLFMNGGLAVLHNSTMYSLDAFTTQTQYHLASITHAGIVSSYCSCTLVASSYSGQNQSIDCF